MTLANGLTILRILLVPLLVITILSPGIPVLFAFLFFLFIALTDGIDGWIARKTKTVTALGKFLDPLADKILVFSLFLLFVEQQKISFIWIAIMLAREFAVMGIRSLAALNNHVIQADWSGKVKTVLQMLVISWLILSLPYLNFLVLPMVLISVLSGFHYYWINRTYLRT